MSKREQARERAIEMMTARLWQEATPDKVADWTREAEEKGVTLDQYVHDTCDAIIGVHVEMIRATGKKPRTEE